MFGVEEGREALQSKEIEVGHRELSVFWSSSSASLWSLGQDSHLGEWLLSLGILPWIC